MVEPALVDAVEVAGPTWGCRALGVPLSSYYCRKRAPAQARAQPGGTEDNNAGSNHARTDPRWTLSVWQRLIVLAVLCCDEFCESAPAQVFYTLLDRGIYLCSISSMYRILHQANLVHDRRPQRSYPSESRRKPRLRATGPNLVWSWDITMLYGPARVKWHLYVIMDIFSRKVVGWRLEDVEDDRLAAELIEKTCATEYIERGKLTIHADRGPAMTSQTVYDLFCELGIAGSHSRPRVSDDNPYSEAGFKTLKYCPAFPGRFDTKQDAIAWCEAFFDWYNHEHRHSGIGFHTAATVHDGTAITLREQRQVVLDAAYAATPERFRNKAPTAPRLPRVAWINQPKENVRNKI